MQRINYENLSQAPLLSSGVGCPPYSLQRESTATWWGGSWEVRRVGDAGADPKSRNMQDQATPMKLRMSHTMDTETEPQAGPPLGQL